EIDVQAMGIDLLSLSAHKFRGPKGIGALYCRKGIALKPLVYGGGQERGLASGTENVAGMVGLGVAIEEATGENLRPKMDYVKKLTDRLVEGIMKIPYTHYTGDPVNRLPGTASFIFEAIEGEGLILRLDFAGICASTGSACSTGSLDPSHVLMAIGLPHEIAHGSLRLTLGEQNTEEDVDYLIETVTKVVDGLRAMSPVWINGKPDLTAAADLHH
ncbi:MAG: aminotransferase class V-fold PLP-dependent enzyme, partial [Butyricicoccus sp.]|nr:aminotransferase class V-fold PLP-dependent enzyme [Butyricicoccus sp.]